MPTAAHSRLSDIVSTVADRRKEKYMVYLWRYADEAGVVAPGPDIAFGSQDEAERWLGETWSDLLASGISAVSLFNDHQAVYGPMELADAV
jgi:hypothetical protein